MKCKRCGACCYLIIDRKPTDIPCKHLRFKPDGTTYCDIYKHRLRTELGYGNVCTYRKDSMFDYWECPHNTNKLMVKDYKVVGQ